MIVSHSELYRSTMARHSALYFLMPIFSTSAGDRMFSFWSISNSTGRPCVSHPNLREGESRRRQRMSGRDSATALCVCVCVCVSDCLCVPPRHGVTGLVGVACDDVFDGARQDVAVVRQA